MRSYDGPAIDLRYQYITERPELGRQSGETVYATDPEPQGEERTENVPGARRDRERELLQERPDVDGQSTFEDWWGDRS